MPDDHSLAALQRRFFALVVPGEGAEAAPCELLDVADEAAALRRLEIYRSGYVARFASALRLEYPKLAAALGPRLRALVPGYAAAFPPVAGPLRAVGRHLAAYLDREAPGWPAELARLEWARCEAAAADAHVPLTLAAMTALDPAAWGDVILRRSPSVRQLALAWPAHELWQRVPAEPAPARTALLVWRRDDRVLHRPLGDGEAEALAQLGDGLAFGALCERLIERLGERTGERTAERTGADAAQVAFALMQRWLADGVLVSTIAHSADAAQLPSPNG
jgi:hypothetical protein